MFGSKQWKRLMTAALIVAAPAWAHGALLAPYSNDFSSSADDFTLSAAGGGWTLDTGGTGTLGHSGTTLPAGTNYTAAVEVSNLGGAAVADFVISGKYTATAGAGSFSYVGLVALGDTSALSNTYYLVRHHMSLNSNNLRILRVVDGTASTELQMTAERLDQHFGDAHELTVAGTYVDTDSSGSKDALELIVTLKNLTDGTQWVSAAYQDTSPLTGHFFGIKDSNANLNASLAVAWDAFHVTPEPGSLGLMALGLGLMLLPSRVRR